MGSENTTRTSAASARVSTSPPCGGACATSRRGAGCGASGHRNERTPPPGERPRNASWSGITSGKGPEVYRAAGCTGAEGCRGQACSGRRLRAEDADARTRGVGRRTRGPQMPAASKSKYTEPPSTVLAGDPIVYETVNGAARGQDIHRQIFERNLAVQLLIDPKRGGSWRPTRRLRLLRVRARSS